VHQIARAASLEGMMGLEVSKTHPQSPVSYQTCCEEHEATASHVVVLVASDLAHHDVNNHSAISII
jgi:hypothetical protein